MFTGSTLWQRKACNINAYSLLSLAHLGVFFMDIENRFLACNEHNADLFQLKDTNEATGKTIFDFSLPDEQANLIHQGDLKVLQYGETVQSTYSLTRFGKTIDFITYKAPVKNDAGDLIGLYGIVNCLNTTNAAPYLDKMHQSGVPFERIFKRLEQYQLTKRQQQCLYYLAQGKSAKQIAIILELSYRTVENYLAALKAKWGVKNKTELIVAYLEKVRISE